MKAQKQAALAAPDGYALVSIDALKAWGKYDEVRNACQYPAEQTEQEPIGFFKQNDEGFWFEASKYYNPEAIPLYAAPVQQVDLTKEDKLALWKKWNMTAAQIDAVIAAYKEKNK